MSAGYFFIEYKDGKYTEIKFKTTKMAEKAYKLYCKEPEDNAKGWGWDTEYDKPTLAQQIRQKKTLAVSA